MNPISRRSCLAGVLATLAGLGASRHGQAAALAAEERPVVGFDAVLWDATGELLIEQTNRERLVVEAEPAVLAKIVAEVRDGRLHLRFRPGPVQTQQPIRFRLEVKTLTALETRGSGAVRIGTLSLPALSLRLTGSEELQLAGLTARRLDVQLEGAGSLRIAAGRVDSQRVVISGAADYDALGLASRHADVAITGSGELRVAVTERLVARIAGSGTVLYRGQPQLVQTITGAGEIRPLDARGP
ncbi:MAG TPA: head GIN domain-containing protein [Albitalea sp.]|jgi:hypothetical protein|nr:head GIN domain-containing protein [Albitalea sp.]